jgi:hypothetical protein
MAQTARDGEDMSLWELGTGTFPLSEKIIAATQSWHNAIENVPSGTCEEIGES